MTSIVLDMKDHRPVWAMPDWVAQEIRAALPSGRELHVIDEETDGSGDGATRVSAALLEQISTADVYLGFGVSAELLRAGPGLRWVHTGAAGVGGSLHSAMREGGVVFTNSVGIHAPPMAETAIGMMLHFARGLDLAEGMKHTGEWSTDAFYGQPPAVRELSRSTVGVVGFGGIGREVARRAAAMGARVLAVRRRESGERREGLTLVGDSDQVAGVAEVAGGAEALRHLLAESDYVVVAAPATPETHRMIDEEALAGMKPGSVLINLSRGSLVDEDALVRALRRGHLRGAALDVFAVEPLPKESPLWGLQNVVVCPHVSAVTPHFWRREAELIMENLSRYFAGQPLLNVVDVEAGY